MKVERRAAVAEESLIQWGGNIKSVTMRPAK
jgi:hypothetical protein